MKQRAIRILLFLLSVSLLGCVTAERKQAAAAAAAVPRITSINIMDNAVEIGVSGDFSYSAYKPSDPFTVAVDLVGVDAGDFGGKISSDKAGIAEVNVSGTSTPLTTARLEILLSAPSAIEAMKTGGSLLVKVKEEAETAPMAAMAAGEEAVENDPPPAQEEEEALPPATKITSVAFDYTDGTLKLVIKGDGALSPDIYALAKRIVVDVPGVKMEAAMPAAVVSPVKAVRYGLHDDTVRLIVELKKDVQFDASTVADRVVIALPADEVLEILSAEKTPEAKAAAPGATPEEAEEGKYTGKIISLDFQDADIVPIFRFIGDISGYNVVVHPTVTGKVTLKLLNVPWDQALDIVMGIYSLEKQIEGNIMTIAPTSVFDRLAKEKAARKATDTVTAELVRKIIHLEHIDATAIKSKIDEEKALSPRGIVTIDAIGNNVRVKDTEENLQKVMEIVRDYDKPMYGTQQVMVEAKIVLIASDHNRTLGIDWDVNFGVKLLGTPTTGTFGISTLGASATGGTGTATIPNPLAGSVISGTAPYATVNLTLSALETMGGSKTLSNPRVLTINGKAANIQAGTQIPVTTTTAEGSTTEFVSANLKLAVTPTIKPNDVVELVVQVNKDEPTTVGGSTGIDTRSVTTQALVKDGETLVLGGIYEKSGENNEKGLPGLRKIPILGWLFKSQAIIGSTDELLILITPRVIKGEGQNPAQPGQKEMSLMK